MEYNLTYMQYLDKKTSRDFYITDEPGPLSFRLGPFNFHQYKYPNPIAIPLYKQLQTRRNDYWGKYYKGT